MQNRQVKNVGLKQVGLCPTSSERWVATAEERATEYYEITIATLFLPSISSLIWICEGPPLSANAADWSLVISQRAQHFGSEAQIRCF
jgi:hypothetical protein